MKSNFSLATVAEVARRHGFDVTDEEVAQGWAEAGKGELTALELELVSAGGASVKSSIITGVI